MILLFTIKIAGSLRRAVGRFCKKKAAGSQNKPAAALGAHFAGAIGVNPFPNQIRITV
jgi:hypothetical protein